MKKILYALCLSQLLYAGPNQTDDLSVVSTDAFQPFQIRLETADFTIPGGIHSGASAQYGSKYLFIAGRTNGLHGFNNNDNNFPISQQNTDVIVIDVCTQQVWSRSLLGEKSGLTQEQVDTLSVTSPQSYQAGNTLYMTGGYGVETSSGNFFTKDTLTAIDVPGLINWVICPSCPACTFIRQISDPVFQVTGGEMFQTGQCPTLLMVGQNFTGFYADDANGDYTRQVRRFNIIDDGKCLGVNILPSTPQDPNYRRRDLNIIPIVEKCCDDLVPAYVILSGVFTLETGIWTVPVEVTADGQPSMADPTDPGTFKQAMNNYASAHVELFSKSGCMYSILFGGLTFGFFENGEFMTDSGVPFTNQITVLKRTSGGSYTQHLLPVEYPTILSTLSNPGNRLLFGTGAFFVTAPNVPAFSNGVLMLEEIKKPTVIGYIVGGIASTLPNTNTITDSFASPYIFKVILTPGCCS